METKREIKISEVLGLLDAGKSREEIAQHFNMSNGDLTVLFKHPSLKGRKAKKQRDFVVVDDVTETTVEEQETIVEDEVVNDLQEETTTEEQDIPQSSTPWEN